MSDNQIVLVTRVVVISIGIVGNFVSFLVFTRPTFKKNSISTYSQALAIAESHIIWQLGMDIPEAFFGIVVNDQTNFLCKMFFYVMTAFTTIPCWILVAFSIDKLLCMTRSSYEFIKKKRFQWSAIVGIAVFHLLLYIEIPILLKLELNPWNNYICDMSTMSIFNEIAILYLLESAIIPFIIMIVTSTMSIVSIRRSRRNLERSGGNVDQSRKSREVKYAISSLAFNFTFIILKCPVVIVYILYGNDIVFPPIYQNAAMLLFFANASMSFFIHFLSNSLFRREFLILIRVKSRASIQPVTKTSVHTAKTLSSTIAIKIND